MQEKKMPATKPSWARVEGPLEAYAEGFRAELLRLGHTPLTAAGQVRLMAHLSRWLAREGLDVAGLTPERVDAYFAERRAAGYANERTSRALRPLVGYLRRVGAGVGHTRAVPDTPVEALLARYAGYLATERGLAASTVALNVRLVRPFLVARAQARGGGLELDALTAGEVRGFVVEQSRRRPASVKRIATALRSLLRFAHVDGLTGQSLAGAVPRVAGWGLAGLPRALEPAQVAALLATCDPGAATGRRDAAILRLLARLGLRAGEVAALGLADIDWRRGQITVRGKGNRHDVLPLPADVGQAIVDYLADGRPPAALDRTVFIRAQAPYRALSPGGVIQVVVTAGRRAGLGRLGAHRLRHSAATAMLRAGGSLTEIGQVLRHRRSHTTAIYAKVDLDGLRQVARPWPGDAA
jgi:integrase/recombinase XerD